MLVQQIRINILASHPFFTLLTPDDIGKLANLMYEIYVPKGEIIVKEGNLIDSIFLIEEGTAEVTRTSNKVDSKEDILLAKLSKGEAIGLMETGFFSRNKLRSATVTALTEVKLLGIGLKDFNKFMEQSGSLYPNFRQSADIILRINLIKSIHSFSNLNIESINHIMSNIKELKLPLNHVLFREGEPGDICYLLEEGEIEIFRKNVSTQHDESIAKLKPPAIIGEAAILTKSQTRNASVVTKTECKLLALDQNFLFEFFKNDTRAVDSTVILLLSRYHPKHVAHISVEKKQENGNDIIYTLRNKKTSATICLSPIEIEVWNNLDGKHILQDVIDKFSTNDEVKSSIINLVLELYHEKFIDFSVDLAPEIKLEKRSRQGWFNFITKYFK